MEFPGADSLIPGEKLRSIPHAAGMTFLAFPRGGETERNQSRSKDPLPPKGAGSALIRPHTLMFELCFVPCPIVGPDLNPCPWPMENVEARGDERTLVEVCPE